MVKKRCATFTFLFNYNFLLTMRKTTSLREYSAPELEVVSTIVEQGFTMSNVSTIDSADEINYETEF